MSSGSKAAFYVAIGAFWWDFLEQKPLFWIIFGPWAETLLPSGKTYLAELSKLFSTCPYKQLKEEHDSQNFFISIIFGRWAISFGIWQRFLGSIVKTTFYTSIEKLRGEKFCWQTVFWKKSFVSFGTWAESFWSSRKILSANLSELHYTRPQKK